VNRKIEKHIAIDAKVQFPLSERCNLFESGIHSGSDFAISTGFTRGYSNSASSMKRRKTKNMMQKMQKVQFSLSKRCNLFES
jgi:hypothetical protein